MIVHIDDLRWYKVLVVSTNVMPPGGCRIVDLAAYDERCARGVVKYAIDEEVAGVLGPFEWPEKVKP